ncbi:MAG: hypothetical protein JRI25_15725 [Deltaproteobacteria bacterium]|nr:hypothetical protein [Deltaproteobacteria bacterium]
MYHLVAKGMPKTLLFHDHIEALALWRCILNAAPGPVALFLMPTHVHGIYRQNAQVRLVTAMRAYARWRNAHRGEHGPVWVPAPEPVFLADRQKRSRTERYVLLNGCRRGLHDDPLSWAWSTHRDAVGLAVPAMRNREKDPERYHAYVSADRHVDPDGTELPMAGQPLLPGERGLIALRVSVSAVMRAPIPLFGSRGPPRTALVHTAKALGSWSTREIADFTGLTLHAVRKVEAREDRLVRVVSRVAGDPRFPGLHTCDLRDEPRWALYRDHR